MQSYQHASTSILRKAVNRNKGRTNVLRKAMNRNESRTNVLTY